MKHTYTFAITVAIEITVEASTQLMAKYLADTKYQEMLGPVSASFQNYDIELVRDTEEKDMVTQLQLIDDNNPFCVFIQNQGVDYYYHLPCARYYFDERVDEAIALRGRENNPYYPKDEEGNLILIYRGDEWKDEVREHVEQDIDLDDTCSACGGSLYDEPQEIEKL